jgi:hypothetical protein
MLATSSPKVNMRPPKGRKEFMFAKQVLLLSTIFVLGMCPLAAQMSPDTTLTIAVTGTLGPILAGTDPLGANGHTGSLTLKASESLMPVKQSGNVVTYRIPAGAITVVIGTLPFTTTTPSKMTIKLTSVADILTVLCRTQNDTITGFRAFLAPGSWNSSVLMNPLPFSPSPQTLTSATVANGPGSELAYISAGAVTVLGLNGTASNSAASDGGLPDFGFDQ